MANKRNDWGDNLGNYLDEILSRRDIRSEHLFLEAVHGRFGRLISFTMIALMAVTTILLVTIFSIVEAIVPSLAEERTGSEPKRDADL
ncbi:hypothetical protein N8E89_23600 (plasmid) [Phyllobacterium sp. A18/5-2]|uniref:hypothetical protein n=1 Tax=Phyllobacterium sp. A18/5-2 TaxID=2978392 RepID=UPI0021C87B33|nr:hypothetical protein [Phyllobacterium sp. A18/5-2]UXN66181.1 hypothetical protein N8E89_23600 [Phyllobacterium sp. A18/5-2]